METLLDYMIAAVVDSTDDLMCDRLCRCGCGQSPQTDHYIPPDILEIMRALGDDIDEAD